MSRLTTAFRARMYAVDGVEKNSVRTRKVGWHWLSMRCCGASSETIVGTALSSRSVVRYTSARLGRSGRTMGGAPRAQLPLRDEQVETDARSH